MKKGKQKREGFNILLALLFSLVLFFNANGTKTPNSALTTEAYEETVTDVPVSIIYDSDDYFISGYDATVKVKLKSINRIQLNAEASQETRSFKVVADLSDLTPGTHDVKLDVQDLSNSVSATVDPEIMTVTIENKVTKSFPVEANFSNKELADGVSISKTSLSPATVEVTTGDQTVKDIAKVIAPLESVSELTESTEQTVNVYAVNSNGEVLPAEIDPETVTVQILVNSPQKDVGLSVEQTGTVSSGISYFEFQFGQSHATISGNQTLLDSLDTISIPVDITGITETSTVEKSIPVDEGLIADPAVVEIKVVPIFEGGTQMTDQSETTATTDSSSSSSSSKQEKTTGSSVADNN